MTHCPTCAGRGTQTYTILSLFGWIRLNRIIKCPACHGRGLVCE